MNRLTSLFFALGWVVLVSTPAIAQIETLIEFESPDHEFGELEMSQTEDARHRFIFRNVSSDPVKLTAVKASCGCTTPQWSDAFVMPGDTGGVTALYSTWQRAGIFKKTITVFATSARNVDENGQMRDPMARQVVRLSISGDVIADENDPVIRFPAEMGRLRVDRGGFDVGTVTPEATVEFELGLFNQDISMPVTIGKLRAEQAQPLAIRQVSPDPAEPTVLAAFDSVRLTYAFDVSSLNSYGRFNLQVYLETDDETQEQKPFFLSGNIQEDFSALTEEERANAAHAAYDLNVVDFGDQSAGAQLERSVRITNTGKSPLHIRSVESTCTCITANPQATEIAPGKSTELRIQVDGQLVKNRLFKFVKVVTNDPDNSDKRLAIKANFAPAN